jgi:hypothetical protein
MSKIGEDREEDKQNTPNCFFRPFTSNYIQSTMPFAHAGMIDAEEKILLLL